MNPNNGGAAFPTRWPRSDDADYWTEDGMSLRDYFAARAMHAELLSAGSFEGPADALRAAAKKAGQGIEERIAVNAYSVADAMIAQREK